MFNAPRTKPKGKTKALRIGMTLLLSAPAVIYIFLLLFLHPGDGFTIGKSSVRKSDNSIWRLTFAPAYNVYSMRGDVPSMITCSDDCPPNYHPPCPHYIPARDGHNIQIGTLIFFIADVHRDGRWVFRPCASD